LKYKDKKMNTIPIYLKIPAELKQKLKQLSAYEGISMTVLVIECLRSGLAHRKEFLKDQDKKIYELLHGAGIND
jgi:hypothetical protein